MFNVRRGKLVAFLVLTLALIGGAAVPVFAQATSVSTFEELKAAVEKGGEINVTKEIVVTETLVVKEDVTISGGSLKWAPADRSDQKGDQMFKVNEGKTLALKDITLDGNEQGRLINVKGGTVNLENATLQNGSTEKLEQNTSNDQNYSGGAILATGGSTLTITNGVFENNNTGTKELDPARAAEGGAIKIDSSTLTIDGTSFIGNHLDNAKDKGGRQGGAIEATKTTVVIKNATFAIPGPFDTGGAIKFENCTSAEVTHSNFTIDENKGEFGVAGGAITSEGSNLTINNSTFKAGKGTRVSEAGGLIQVCLGGTFNLNSSTLEGAGAWWNGGRYTANTGGAISFYDNCTVTANITDTTIKNIMADGNGAGIALTKGNEHSSNVNLTLKNTTIENAAAYTWQGNSYGGCMYVGDGNTVKIDGGKISGGTTSNFAAGIYNKGDLEITGGAQITGNTAYQMVGGIYHDGTRLKIDEASFSNNHKGDNTIGYNHILGNNEKSGVNIYADQDVIITPNATFDENDIRVFDGKSSILLTGKLTKQMNVSISEKEKAMSPTETPNPLIEIFKEEQYRKVGYVVAKGEGYTPTAEDAKMIHYVTNDTSQAVAAADKHDGIGEWDYVLNPKTKVVVLGQRVKVTLHANGTDAAKAEFKEVKVGRNEEEGIFTTLVSDNQKEDVYDVYASGEKSAELTPEPTRKGYAFTGWYKEAIVNDDAPDEGKDGKTLVKNLKLVENAEEITKIIDPHEFTLYAGWEKVIPVEKAWNDSDDRYKNRPEKVSVQLYSGNKEIGQPIELSADKDWKGEFKDLPESNVDPKTYTVKEVPEQIAGYEKGVITGDATNGFTVTNSTEFMTIEGKKIWDHTGNDGDKPTAVTVRLLENGKEIDKKENVSGWRFENLPKYKNKTLVNYSLKEDPVDNYTSTQEGNNFKNTYSKKFKVVYKFEASGTDKELPKEVISQKPEDEKDKEKGTVIAPKTPHNVTTDEGTWEFKGWEPEEQTIVDKDIEFRGTWNFTEKTSDYTVTKTVDKTEFEKAGDQLTYTVTVKNTGEKDLTGLTISDPKTTFENPTFDLAKGKEKTFTYTYTVSEADVKNKEITNVATVTLGEKSVEGSTMSKLKTTPTPQPPTDKIITRYVDDNDNNLIDPKKGDYPKATIPGYEFVETKRTENLVTHIYKKLSKEKPTTDGYINLTYVPVSDDGLLNKEDHKAYMFGYPDGNFLPDRNMTREEVTAMFARLLKDYPRERRSYNIPYNDVDTKDWSYEAIGFMTEKGIIKGYEDGSFRPEAAISRAEFAAIASRFDQLTEGNDNRFFDVPADHWAVASIDSAAAKGWVSGYPDGSFRPERKITRSEVVSITNIMLDRFADKEFVRSHLSEMIHFKDLTEDNWAYFPIMEATHGHDYTRKPQVREENWIRLNGEEFRFPLLYRK